VDARKIIAEAFELLNEKTRWKFVPVRIRRGKVERRRKVSNIQGWTFRGGKKNRKLVRITPQERMRRRVGARRGKIKRRGKKNQIRIKYRRSMRRLKALRGGR
jgi:hypothetical protein